MHELRCDNGILFGILEGSVLEVKCRSRRCGYETGVVVIHRFRLETGDLVGTTQRYKDPKWRKEAVGDDKSPVRSA
jgi:hypothetical protein